MSRFISVAGYKINVDEISHTHEPETVMYASLQIFMKNGQSITLRQEDKLVFKKQFEEFTK